MSLPAKKKSIKYSIITVILIILFVVLAFISYRFPVNSFYRIFYRSISYLIFIVFSLSMVIRPTIILELLWNKSKKMDNAEIVLNKILGIIGVLCGIYQIIQLIN